MTTAEVKKLLFTTMQRPTKKNLARLAEGVISVCDALDQQDTLGAIIRAGNESLDHSFYMMQKLMEKK
jgi:hypothetical protein